MQYRSSQHRGHHSLRDSFIHTLKTQTHTVLSTPQLYDAHDACNQPNLPVTGEM
jgi:hypothetical protein